MIGMEHLAIRHGSRTMSFDPQKWFISALLFFGVLVPGSIAVAILGELVRRWGGTLPVTWPPASTFDWTAFLVTGFVAGYLAHPPSHVLNVLYNRTYRAWRRRNGDRLLDEIRRIAGDEVGPNGSHYAWATRRLRSRAPRDLAHVEMVEGISKGFRTLALIAAIGVVLASATGQGLIALICLILFCLAFLVFCERRFAATSEAYGSVTALEQGPGNSSAKAGADSARVQQ